MDLNEQIKKEREKQGITKYKLSRLIGTSPTNYGHLEAGVHSPSLDMVKRICNALNVSITFHPDNSTDVKTFKK